MSDAQLLRAIYSNWDFQQALSALSFLLEECDFGAKYNYIQLRKFRCYETSVIISFSRPFESSRSATALGLKAIGVRLEREELALQQKVLNLRRKVVAHSDEEAMHFKGVLLQPFEDTDIQLPHFRYSESLHLHEHDFQLLDRLLRRLIHGITGALFAIAKTAPKRLERYKAPVL